MSQECVEYASCPVVVVRTDRLVGDGDVILVGKDGSEGAVVPHTRPIWPVPLATDRG
jgi:hypothetical protein